MSSLIGTADCIHCNKVKSGCHETVNGWLCDECYNKIYYGIRRIRPVGVISKHHEEYDRMLSDEEIEKAFGELSEGMRLRSISNADKTSPDGKILIDTENNTIFLSEDVGAANGVLPLPVAYRLSRLSDYFLMFESAVLSKTDSAIKNAYVVLEFDGCQIKYAKIPLGRPKGFFNFQRKMFYRKHSKELMTFLAEVLEKPHKKEITVLFKQQ